MEAINHAQTTQSKPALTHGNDNRPDHAQAMPASGRSLFPKDALARIYRPARSVVTSARTTQGWRLVFERRAAPFIEPLMGYTGSADTLTQVELNFPTLEAATRYAQRQGLNYVVQDHSQSDRTALTADQKTAEDKTLSDVVWQRLQAAWLWASQAYGLSARFKEVLDSPEAFYASPFEVAVDPALSLEEKRAVLRNWAWNEYLLDLATAEGMPENQRPARLDEVEQALLVLEGPGRVVQIGPDSHRARSAA